jgi:hypothetical protein
VITDFDFAFAVVVRVPFGAEVDDLLVEFGADATAHADDHAFAFHRSKAIAKVVENVLSNECLPFLAANHRFELCPFALELVFGSLLFAFGYVLEVGINFGFLALVEGNFGEAGFVVDADGSSIFDGALDVVDVDVVAEDRLCAGIRFVDRSSGETDERGVGRASRRYLAKP